MRVLLFTLVLVSCSEPNYGFTTMMCPKDEVDCKFGSKKFSSLQECEEFVRQASKFQPNVGRVCVKAERPAGVY